MQQSERDLEEEKKSKQFEGSENFVESLRFFSVNRHLQISRTPSHKFYRILPYT